MNCSSKTSLSGGITITCQQSLTKAFWLEQPLLNLGEKLIQPMPDVFLFR